MSNTKVLYTKLEADLPSDDIPSDDGLGYGPSINRGSHVRRLCMPVCISTAAFLAMSIVSYFAIYFAGQKTPVASHCKDLEVRREWRALSKEEKQEYVSAVSCLATIPSGSVIDGTLYDEFAWLHAGIGSWCHHSASFLPWHRYTLHLYEKRLRNHCGYKGTLPYWDWGLDWMDLASSSIWDPEHGFGGDGDTKTPVTVGDGRCVTDGPFSHLQPIQYNQSRTQHCLSRGFRDGEQRGKLPALPYSPEKINQILMAEEYEAFVHEVENSVHNVMHLSVGGDFMALTAANDPIFYVHHAQLDHLWWKWQQERPGKRLKEYAGKHMYNSTGGAHLEDMLLLGGLAPDVPVSQVIDSASGLLCYRYA